MAASASTAETRGMASWVFCNCCFQPPSQASCFSLTNCGHVYCEACLGKGKKDECMICKVPCRTVLLSKHTNSEIQTFFMDIDDLCKKFSRDMSQILEFQEMHRKRLLAFYREQISMLEESLRTSWLRIEELWSMRSSQQAAFSPIRNSVSTPYAKPGGRLWQPLSSLARDRVESTDIHLPSSPAKKPEVAVGPTRISLISPPRDEPHGQRLPQGPSASQPDTTSDECGQGSQDSTTVHPLQGTVTESDIPASRRSGQGELPLPRKLPGRAALPGPSTQAADHHPGPAAEAVFREVSHQL